MYSLYTMTFVVTHLSIYYDFFSLPLAKKLCKKQRLSTVPSTILNAHSFETDVGAMVSKAWYNLSKSAVLSCVASNEPKTFESFREKYE